MKANTDGLTMNQLAERNAEHVATISALESRCAALSAENAAMKSAKEIIRHLNANREEANFCGIDDCHIDDAVEAMLTPATDAFLAEVRAQGVEMFSEKFGGGTPLSNMVKEVAADFAAKLRKGVAK
ncbi:hypothetical protein S657_004333 [Salmonella enterica subsp. enterica]|nr:hypothetical protein [Salmonella enterica subsp. enterica serovar Javiana]EEJ2566961.1 hypothetical protein [Salmonella enterica subsp. enterica]EGS0259823.1 hypothetical protein [Salmonella enterica]